MREKVKEFLRYKGFIMNNIKVFQKFAIWAVGGGGDYFHVYSVVFLLYIVVLYRQLRAKTH